MTPQERRLWQDGQIKRLENVLAFLDAVRDDDALLASENQTGMTPCRTIQAALLNLGLSHLGTIRTVGEVRQFIGPYRDDLAEFIRSRDVQAT